ncbi:MAG: hypothetical protein V4548_02515 [Bacteroidota bacterium]
MFKDGTFYNETGCCTTSYFSFGNWTQEKNIIQLKPVDLNKFKVIKKVVKGHIDSEKLTVKIFDNKGQNITDKIDVMYYFENTMSIRAYDLVLDGTMTKSISPKDSNGTLILRTLQPLFKQKIQIQTDKSNYYEIWLNISGDWFYNSVSEWSKRSAITLTKTSEGLSTTNTYTDKNGVLKKKIYLIRSK